MAALKEISLGKTVYDLHCSVCHNLGMNGAPKLGNDQNWEPLIKSGIDKLYHIAINGNSSMPAKGGCDSCSQEDIKAAVDYMTKCASTNLSKGSRASH
jgi:cytochrome c5